MHFRLFSSFFQFLSLQVEETYFFRDSLNRGLIRFLPPGRRNLPTLLVTPAVFVLNDLINIKGRCFLIAGSKFVDIQATGTTTHLKKKQRFRYDGKFFLKKRKMTSSIITNDEWMKNYSDDHSINRWNYPALKYRIHFSWGLRNVVSIPRSRRFNSWIIRRMKNIQWNLFPYFD